MLEKGWIEPAKDAVYAAPVLMIKKLGTYEDGSSKGYRFCTDFRGLNSVVKPLKHHIPDIYEMWDHLKETKYISVCDMKHQSASQYLFITLELEVLLISKLHTVALPCLYFVFLLYWLRWLRLPSWCAM